MCLGSILVLSTEYAGRATGFRDWPGWIADGDLDQEGKCKRWVIVVGWGSLIF